MEVSLLVWLILSMKSVKCHLESCQRPRRQWCKTVEGKRGAICGACGGGTGVMVTECSNCWTEHSVICMLRQRNVYTLNIYNKEKQQDDEREGWLRRIPVCYMHPPIWQIILWWCMYWRIRIHRSYSLYNTSISIFCFNCIHLKLKVYN